MKDTMLSGRPRSPGDASFVAFVEVAWQRHFRLALLLTGNPLRAEDLLQDSLVKLYERWHTVTPGDEPHAYLRRMLTNGEISRWRRRRRERLVPDVPDRPSDTREPHPDADTLLRALRALPPRQRAVVVLRHYQDMSERSIAELLGCSVGTVKSQNAKALNQLRHVLRDTDFRIRR